ncbi:MAG: outer membrane beta-barrel protein [Gammaproteobacteria bacterium]|nr:outer membrane beta-barrel protein [Gammaproteobacteria bacterium]
MHLTQRVLVIGILLLATGHTVRAENYARVLGALASLDGYSDSYALGVSVGRDLPRLAPHLGVEGEFFKSFSKMDGTPGDVTFNKTAAFVTYTYPIELRIYMHGKVGLRYAALKNSVTGDDSDVGVDWGVGAMFALDHHRNVVLEFITSDENNFSQLALGLQFFY